MKTRLHYLISTVLLIIVEVLIALFVHDSFIRPFIGDVIVVIVVYTFIRIFIPKKWKMLPLGVFIFATGVEVLQLFHFADLLGFENNRFMQILLGSVFDFKDILCYAAGCLLLGIHEFGVRKLNVKEARNV